MDKQTPQELIDKYLSGEATTAEKNTLESWYLQHTENSKDVLPEPDYENLSDEMWPLIHKHAIPLKKQIRLWPRIAAAVAIATIGFGIWFYNTGPVVNHHAEYEVAAKQNLSQNDIAPGKNTAVLMLANGKTIHLSDAKTGVVVANSELKYNDGSRIAQEGAALISAASPQQLTAVTPRGGMYVVTLPDGSKVWLNAASSIKFPNSFKNEVNRIVRLTGEAYFEVHKDSAHPFIVISGRQRVEVLGTHFNINAYEDEENVRTTLLEGSVRVGLSQNTTARKGGDIMLKPNQQAVLKPSKAIDVVEVSASEVIDWKNGEFVSKNESLASIMRKISRWYNVDVVYTREELKNKTFDGSLSRYDNVSRVLKVIEFAGAVKFKFEGKTITVLDTK
jgi:transmembrane sensor